MTSNPSAANLSPAGQSAFARKLRRDRSDGSVNLSAIVAANRAFPAAVADCWCLPV